MRIYRCPLFGYVDLDHVLQVGEVIDESGESGFGIQFAFVDSMQHRSVTAFNYALVEPYLWTAPREEREEAISTKARATDAVCSQVANNI